MLAVSALVLIGAAPVVNAADRADSKSTKRDALSVSLSANLAPEPAQVNVRVRIEPDPRSRFLMLEWWSEDGIGGSRLITLEGDRSATRQEFPLKQIAAGQYLVTAILRRDDGSEVRRAAQLIVVPGASRFTPGGASGVAAGY
jgi:hypothetical protein